jgi:hypothetical protein
VQLRYGWQDEAVRAVNRITGLAQERARRRPAAPLRTVTPISALTTLGGR